jgi:hypothetical protein
MTGAGVTPGAGPCTTGGALIAELSTIGAGVRDDEQPASPATIPAASVMPAIVIRGFDAKPSLCITTSFLMLFVFNFSNFSAALSFGTFIAHMPDATPSISVPRSRSRHKDPNS